VPDALRRLQYTETEIKTFIAHIEKHDTIEDVEENGKTIPAVSSRSIWPCLIAHSKRTKAARIVTWRT